MNRTLELRLAKVEASSTDTSDASVAVIFPGSDEEEAMKAEWDAANPRPARSKGVEILVVWFVKPAPRDDAPLEAA
jgi:hypothetical protein